jgi:hypothetical protein
MPRARFASAARSAWTCPVRKHAPKRRCVQSFGAFSGLIAWSPWTASVAIRSCLSDLGLHMTSLSKDPKDSKDSNDSLFA